MFSVLVWEGNAEINLVGRKKKEKKGSFGILGPGQELETERNEELPQQGN